MWTHLLFFKDIVNFSIGDKMWTHLISKTKDVNTFNSSTLWFWYNLFKVSQIVLCSISFHPLPILPSCEVVQNMLCYTIKGATIKPFQTNRFFF